MANGAIHAVAVQPDGKILLGGDFTTVGGQTRNRIARVNADGSLDMTFNPNANGLVYAILVQPNGGMVIGGQFGTIGGQTRSCVARLNADGTLDTGINLTFNNNGFASNVQALGMQADGKILVGGIFALMGGQQRNGIGRLNVDGTLDPDFHPGSDVNGKFYTLAIQRDGRILMGGFFSKLSGQPRYCFGRITADGAFDSSFSAQLSGSSALTSMVQPDGKIWTGGSVYISGITGDPGDKIARLGSDGSLDPGFSAWANNTVRSCALQADGKIVLGGDFTNLCGQARSFAGRLNPDSTLDNSFNLSANGVVYGLAVQQDGKLLVGGSFTSLKGQARSYIARVNPTSAATQNLTCDGSTIIWQRGGGSAEIWRATFEVSTNGNGWMALGDAQYVSSAWQIDGLNLPSNCSIRARGFATGGEHNGSGSMLETLVGPGVVSSQPLSRTNNAGTVATFSVQADGVGPIGYQWYKDGVSLVNGTGISGAQTSTLTLSNVFAADAGGYWAVISNSSGNSTSHVATLTVIDPIINKSPTNQMVNAGQTAVFNVTATGSAPIFYQWRKDGANLTGANSSTLTLTNVQSADSGSYDVMVSNAYGAATSSVATLEVILSFPDAFAPNANNLVYAMAVQRDGKILVGGDFTTIGGQSRSRLARLNADGSLDTSFNLGANSTVFTINVQPDGGMLVGGAFWNLAGQTRNYLGRFNPDGTLDMAFNPGASDLVLSMTVQKDNKILVSGAFSSLGGQVRNHVGRLNPDGTVDPTFNPGANNNVYPMLVLPDGKILVAGLFTNIAGLAHKCIAKLNSDGSVDPTFNPQVDNSMPQTFNIVRMLALQADGKILVGGDFTALNGQPRRCIGRLNPDGSLDDTFNPGASNVVHALVVQADGKILVGGEFTQLGGKPCNYLGRLNPDGSVDSTFNFKPGANTNVYSLTLQPDGKILAGGAFTNLNGQTRNNIGRLSNTGPATDSLSIDGSSVTWWRGGTSPELSRATFDISTNGLDWTSLGEGMRIAGGWSWDGFSAPSNSTYIIRGYVPGGRFSGSGWILQKAIGPLAILSSPVSRTNNAGTTATFAVQAQGEPPINYQWYKGGALLKNGRVSGATTATLTMSFVNGADADGYSIVVSNLSSGSVTSRVANLTVIDPVIVNQPTSQYTDVNGAAYFEVGANGKGLDYEWRKEGVALPGATNSTMLITHLQRADIGNYSVVVRSDYGSVTSSIATLTVNLVRVDSFAPEGQNIIYMIVPQPDGKMLVGGSFVQLAGQGCVDMGRLNADGTFDRDFVASMSPPPLTVALQPDGKILMGGYFTGVMNDARSYIARLNADGTVDANFNPGANNYVYSLVLQPDGKILVGGEFTILGGQPCPYLGRLNADGTLDTSFNPGVSGVVNCMALQPDGKIVIGGGFVSVAGQSRNYIARLNADGTLDSAFNPGADRAISGLVVQPDGKVLASGGFSNLAGGLRSMIGRCNADGSLDSSFNPGPASSVYTMALQADGRILAGGAFTSLGGQPRNRLGRLGADGTPDLAFNLDANGEVFGLALESDGAILVNGVFYTLGGQTRKGIGRLINTDSAGQDLSFNGTNIIWTQSGCSPAFWRTTFESSMDGTNWVSLGTGQWIAGRWQLTGVTPAPGSKVRARGYVTGGYHNASSWFVENTLQMAPEVPLSILVNDGGFGWDGSGFGFHVAGGNGRAIVIEGSSNLVDWTAISTNMAGSNVLYFHESGNGGLRQRFYRARGQ